MYNFLFSLSDYIGMTGVILILIAYFFLSTGHWIADSYRYQFLNFIGAWFILFSLFFHWNTSSVTIEIAWVLISFGGLYRLWSKKRANETA
jgi:hypothetical protein